MVASGMKSMKNENEKMHEKSMKNHESRGVLRPLLPHHFEILGLEIFDLRKFELQNFDPRNFDLQNSDSRNFDPRNVDLQNLIFKFEPSKFMHPPLPSTF